MCLSETKYNYLIFRAVESAGGAYVGTDEIEDLIDTISAAEGLQRWAVGAKAVTPRFISEAYLSDLLISDGNGRFKLGEEAEDHLNLLKDYVYPSLPGIEFAPR